MTKITLVETVPVNKDVEVEFPIYREDFDEYGTRHYVRISPYEYANGEVKEVLQIKITVRRTGDVEIERDVNAVGGIGYYLDNYSQSSQEAFFAAMALFPELKWRTGA
uniref:Uncharacterized protein n=1 Tax=Caulobacter phage BL57 TaxID=3348355 RepID=A0AB74UL00_9VIRU